MGILEKLLKKGEESNEGKTFSVGDIVFRPAPLSRDPDAKIEEYWIQTLDVSEDAYWVLVGRRHGVFQLYDWSGKLHRLPSKPPAQSITDIVFRDRYLGVVAPPYLVIYYLEERRDPKSWKSVRISQEGLRPTGGLDIREGSLAFGVVGEKVYVIELAGELTQTTVDFKSTFVYRDAGIGDLQAIKLLPRGKVFLSGTQKSALFSIGGNLLKVLPYAGARAVSFSNGKVYILDNKRSLLVVYDPETEETEEIPYEHKASEIDISPDGRFLFSADEERNRLGVFDLQERRFLGFLEGYGYSVVRVAQDGSVYTSRYEDGDGRRLYFLEKLETNLVDLIYPKERQKQIIKSAQELYKAFKKALKDVRKEEELNYPKPLRELEEINIPLKEVRQLALRARRELEERKKELFIRGMREKISSGTLTGEDYERIRERMERSPEGLEELLREAEEYFKRKLSEHLSRVREEVSGADAGELSELESLPSVKEAREFISSLPREFSAGASYELIKTLQEKLIQDRLNTFRIQDLGRSVRFGREEIEKYEGEQVRYPWRVSVEEKFLHNGKVYARIQFERKDGLVVEPKRYNNIVPQEELKKLPSWVGRYLRHLNGLCSTQSPKFPKPVAFEETPWFVQNLERFTSLVKEQLTFGEGILILEGDAGVGKNFLVEVFSALTNRPLFIVPCNSKMEKEDITFVYEFDPKRGTRRVYSDLVKALRTPGAVIYLDEINTLPPSLVKIFNPLFDYRRYLVLSYGEVVKAHPDVILVGGMNPQNYLGVSELPQDIKSRADIMFVDYPPFEDERGFYYPDEALILKDYVPTLSSLSKEDFTYLWYYVVNDIKTQRGKELLTQERERDILKLFELLKIANEIRKTYRAYQTQQSEEPVEFVFSIRDTVRCARRLPRYSSAKDVVLETIIPKISSPLEREIVKSIVERALE
ncbi:MAG: AAA domain-containing protein [Aquificae bacterium]|nr:AAA domain-containing protein [Aquificota bacterium]